MMTKKAALDAAFFSHKHETTFLARINLLSLRWPILCHCARCAADCTVGEDGRTGKRAVVHASRACLHLMDRFCSVSLKYQDLNCNRLCAA